MVYNLHNHVRITTLAGYSVLTYSHFSGLHTHTTHLHVHEVNMFLNEQSLSCISCNWGSQCSFHLPTPSSSISTRVKTLAKTRRILSNKTTTSIYIQRTLSSMWPLRNHIQFTFKHVAIATSHTCSWRGTAPAPAVTRPMHWQKRGCQHQSHALCTGKYGAVPTQVTCALHGQARGCISTSH